MELQKIYNIVPVWVQNLMCSVKGRAICRRRYNKDFYSELEHYEAGDYHQPTELVKMLVAVKEMDVYKTALQGVNWKALREHEEDVYDVIDRFPIIDKVEVKGNISLYTNPAFSGKQIVMQTSGTTGGGLIFPYSVEMENRQWAIWWRYRRALGITQDTWCGWFGGKTVVPQNVAKIPFWRINNPGRQVMFSSYHLTKENAYSYYCEIKKKNLKWLHGYPSHIARFAAYIIDLGLGPLNNVKFVTTGAENVLGNQLEIMKKAFPEAIIRQHYGLNEGVANISQDKAGEWKVDDDFCYVEFIPVSVDNKNVCRIIGTGFSNLAFPLIRYDTGDLATVERNNDGRITRIVSIDGRSSNAIKQPSGHDIVEASLSIVLHDFADIVEAQFHQRSLNEVELWVVKGQNYSDEVEKQLIKALNNTFEKDIICTIKYVNKVERTKSGKLRIVISEITPPHHWLIVSSFLRAATLSMFNHQMERRAA